MSNVSVRKTNIVEQNGGITVEMLLADTDDIETATEALFLRMAISPKEPKALVQLQQDALSRAQSLLDAEIQTRRSPVRRILEKY